MLTMEEYKVVDKILPNYLEQGDLIKVKGEVFQILNINDTTEGWDLIVIKDNFRESVASKADFEKKLGASWLKDNGLLKLSAFNTVVISRKIERKVG